MNLIGKVLVSFVLVFLTLGLFFYGLLVNLGIIYTPPLENYEVNGFIIMGTAMWFTLFFFTSYKKKEMEK